MDLTGFSTPSKNSYANFSLTESTIFLRDVSREPNDLIVAEVRATSREKMWNSARKERVFKGAYQLVMYLALDGRIVEVHTQRVKNIDDSTTEHYLHTTLIRIDQELNPLYLNVVDLTTFSSEQACTYTHGLLTTLCCWNPDCIHHTILPQQKIEFTRKGQEFVTVIYNLCCGIRSVFPWRAWTTAALVAGM